MTVRNLADETKAILARQAAEAGQSLEAFVRVLLDGQAARGVAPTESLAEWHARVIAPLGLDDEDVEAFRDNIKRGRTGEPADGDPFADETAE